MDAAWIAPPAVLTLGALAAAALARRVAQAADEVRDAQRRFRRLEHALIPIRVETKRARTGIDRLHHR